MQRSLGTRVNPVTIRCMWTGRASSIWLRYVWTGKFLNPETEEKVADWKISGYVWIKYWLCKDLWAASITRCLSFCLFVFFVSQIKTTGHKIKLAQHLRIQIVPLFPQSNKRNILRRPGIEPESTAWKAAMLTTIPPTLWCGNIVKKQYWFLVKCLKGNACKVNQELSLISF